MKKKTAFLAAVLILIIQVPAFAGWYIGGGGWGPSWWSPAGGPWGPGPGWGWSPGWGWGGGFGPGWWGPSYYGYYDGVQDGVSAGLLLSEIDKYIGVKPPAATSNLTVVLTEINESAQAMAQKQAQQMAQLVSQSGVQPAVSSMQSYWQQHGMQTQVVNGDEKTRLGISGFTQGLKILYEIDTQQNNVTVIVGTTQFQMRQTGSASFVLKQ